MEIVTTIECDPEVELVARALYAHNHCPGRPLSEAPWPPKTRPQLGHYLNQAASVVKAQREAQQQRVTLVDISRCEGLKAALMSRPK
ncbi:hypothetical protein [Bradyrhizobium japonicum]|uniref:hypothetical protein n=1 Tax=Bradyrhizobium japonicum TaxID=375 RepID=UPI00042385BA|nr:hypothetical protein [Bradyrhizobium japonicum]